MLSNAGAYGDHWRLCACVRACVRACLCLSVFVRSVKEREALLMQWDRATRFVTRNDKSDLPAHSSSLVFVPFVHAIHDFLLVFRYNYVSILHRFLNIVTYFPKF